MYYYSTIVGETQDCVQFASLVIKKLCLYVYYYLDTRKWLIYRIKMKR